MANDYVWVYLFHYVTLYPHTHHAEFSLHINYTYHSVPPLRWLHDVKSCEIPVFDAELQPPENPARTFRAGW